MGIFWRCVIHSDWQDTALLIWRVFFYFPIFLSSHLCMQENTPITLYFIALFDVKDKECNTQNNSRKGIGCPLRDNSNMSALHRAQREALIIICHLALMMLFCVSQLGKMNEQKSVEKEGKKTPKLQFPYFSLIFQLP